MTGLQLLLVLPAVAWEVPGWAGAALLETLLLPTLIPGVYRCQAAAQHRH